MPRQIQGSQRDFSAGELDLEFKRADDNPIQKTGVRQCANFRILSSATVQNRSGRTARFTAAVFRTEEVLMSAGNLFYLTFGVGTLKVFDATGAQVFTQAGFPWAVATAQNIGWDYYRKAIYITFPGMVPQVLSWDGVTTWSVAAYAEQLNNTQKRTFFYRISPGGITMLPSATGPGAITVQFSSPIVVAGMVGTRMRFASRQILVTSIIDASNLNATVQEQLPNSQSFSFAVLPTTLFTVGDVVIGATSGARGVATVVNAGGMTVQLLPDATGALTPGFSGTEKVVGPGGSANIVGPINTLAPTATTVWDEEVMNAFRGYPQSVFVDQNRLGFCNFPAVPNAIGWSAIGNVLDLYVGAQPANAMFELAPIQSQVLFVLAGPESSEFVFCDNAIFYIPISVTNPLKPGSVAFNLLTRDGAAQVKPCILSDVILFINAGLSSVMSVTATGSLTRPYQATNLTTSHSHLIKAPIAIAAPSTTSQFDERYAYVLNTDGTIACGSYQTVNGQFKGQIGWVPFNGAGTPSWIAALSSDVIFTTAYFGTTMIEALDETKYMDCSVFVNALPAALVPPGGKGPLFLVAPSQSVTLMDQGTRYMGTYQVDANGFIIPQFQGGEDLTLASLVAGQPWTATLEPFAPDAQPGVDVGQRMKLRQISQFAVHFINSTGFLIAMLFSGKQNQITPALGTIMNQKRVPAYEPSENQSLAPVLREWVETYPLTGSTFDPRVAIIKDTPGPLMICEIAMADTV